jgi:2-polyprenyl-3-methyl-5-hydroxy-6-metoxy-1,4-benzoquinol methylase
VILEQRIFDAYHLSTSGRGGTIDRDHYERVAPGLQRRLKGWLPKSGSDVLDLGCGLGGLLYLCERLDCRSLTGVNLCKEEIDVAQRFVAASLRHENLLHFLRASDRSFDWIGCFNILEHLPKDDVLETLELCARHLRPGGSLVVMVPNGLSAFAGTTRYWDITHTLAFVPNNFRQLAPLCGFKSVEFRECAPVAHGVVSTVRSIAWQCVRAVTRLRLLVEVADAKDGIYTMDMMVRLTK